MKKNYILVECIDREINTPEFFETEEQAYNTMAQRVADVLRIQVEDIETYDGDEVGISKSCAWITDYHHLDYDWKIFKLDICENSEHKYTFTKEMLSYSEEF